MPNTDLVALGLLKLPMAAYSNLEMKPFGYPSAANLTK
jgi:hypothetical protein